MTANRLKLNPELKDIKPEEVIAGFKKARPTSILELKDGFLEQDDDKSQEFMIRLHGENKNEDKNKLNVWVKEYFKDILYPKCESKPLHSIKEFLYRKPLPVNPDRVIKAAATKCTAREIALLAVMYNCGICVAKDYKAAFRFFSLADSKDDVVGTLMVGRFYEEGCYSGSVDQDINQARIQYEKACNHLGSALGAHYLGHLIVRFFPAESEVALTCYTDAANKGCSNAIALLGYCFDKGIGVETDIETAKHLYAIAALKGNPFAIGTYGSLVESGDKTWKFLRLATDDKTATTDDKTAADVLLKKFLDKPEPSAALTYHAALGLSQSTPNKKLKKAYIKLCETQPDEVKHLSRELNDGADEILSPMSEAEKDKLALTWFLVSTSPAKMLPSPLIKIVGEYLSFFVLYVVEKEKAAKKEILLQLSKENGPSLFSQFVRAEQGKISYQSVMRNTFK